MNTKWCASVVGWSIVLIPVLQYCSMDLTIGCGVGAKANQVQLEMLAHDWA